jgi:hypothetical protein
MAGRRSGVSDFKESPREACADRLPAETFSPPTVGQHFGRRADAAGERECVEWLFQHLWQLAILALKTSCVDALPA